jgi:hypothetical protein
MKTGRLGDRWGARLSGALICLAAAGSSGCARTVQKAAESAAPAAVEGAVQEAQEPDTRDDIARILADPDIRTASSSLTAAIISGALDGLTDEQRTQELQRLADTMVRTMGASLSRTLRDDVGPQLSEALAQAVDRSIERALDADTEQRLEAMTLAVTRGMVKGMRESMLDENGQPSPVFGAALGRIARDATHEAAFGLDDAVQRAENNDGDEPPARVLAALGTLASFTQVLPLLLLGGLVVFLCLCALPAAWLFWRLRESRRQSRAHREATLALARAIKSTETQAWSSELREHLARETRGSPSAAELQRILRDQAEPGLRSRDGAPRSERSPYVG